MKIATLKITLAGLLLASSSMASAALVDLSSWSAEGSGGNWNVQPGNNSVLQSVNGDPTVFHNNTNSQGNALAGQITVNANSDDDYIGFVLGYNTGDLTNTAADYLLIDWKKIDQNYLNYGTGLAGLAISRVSGELPDGPGAWSHDSADGVTELQRATTLNSTGWETGTTYSFDITFTANLVEVFVNSVKELSIAGSFSDGSMGFYNYSQADVSYAGITEDVIPDPDPTGVPEPSTLAIFALGLVGLASRRIKK